MSFLKISTVQPISIHAPREGGDLINSHTAISTNYFNPRPPRGGRLTFFRFNFSQSGISIHAPREGGDFTMNKPPFGYNISIHAPREGGDRTKFDMVHIIIDISIHAPREGGDLRIA